MPNQVYSSSHSSGGNRTRRLLIAGGVVLLVLLGAAYLVTNNLSKKDNANNGNNKGQNTTTAANDDSPIVPMSMAKNPNFITPNDMSGYERQTDLSVSSAEEYLLTKDESNCDLQYGVAGVEDLPGSTLEEVAQIHLSATPGDDATITSQSAGQDLILKDSTKDRRYVMQTIDLTFVRDNVTYTASDSIAFLPGNKRIFVRRFCPNINGAGATSVDFGVVNKKAKDILVNTD